MIEQFVLIAIYAVYAVIGYYDYKEHLISDLHIIIVSLLGLIYNYFYGDFLYSFFGALLGFAMNYAIYKIVIWQYGEELYGLGDVLLFTSMGFVLGLTKFVSFLQWSAVVVVFLAFLYAVIKRNVEFEMEIPLAPGYVVLLFIFMNVDVYTLPPMNWFINCCEYLATLTIMV